MSVLSNFSCCNKNFQKGDFWFLQDIKGFTARKLYIAKCPVCKEKTVILYEQRISDKKIFINELKGIEAVKAIYRENKRKIKVFPTIEINDLYGWIYGLNVEIKNNSGKVTQIRQYSADFKGNKSLVRKYYEPRRISKY